MTANTLEIVRAKPPGNHMLGRKYTGRFDGGSDEHSNEVSRERRIPGHAVLDILSTDPLSLYARSSPTALACIELATCRHWNYRDLDLDVQRAVTVLRQEGVTRGDRVAVIWHNSVYLLILQQALMRLGGIFIPLNWRLSSLELSRLLADSTPRLLYTEDSLPVLPPNCRKLCIANLAAAIDAAEPAPPCPPPSMNDVCMMLYTSGTSGHPKGVLITPQFLLATAVNFTALGDVCGSSVFLVDAPMFHVIGGATSIWPELMCGGSILISPGFKAEVTNDRLADPALGITHYFCVPQMAEALRLAYNFDPGQWRSLVALFTGGAPNPKANIHRWLDFGVRVVDGYGMTETGTTLGMPLSSELIRAKAGSVGKPGPLTEIRIVDDLGRDLTDGTPGEILISGLNVTTGYWNRTEERDGVYTADGWLRTGDIGRRDEDGYIFILDRKKDVFISGGENIYPVEVEAALMEHPGVREVAVVGVPNERWGEVGQAYIVTTSDRPLLHAELEQHCRALIAPFKAPKAFIFVDSLPRTGSGKVMKHLLEKPTPAK